MEYPFWPHIYVDYSADAYFVERFSDGAQTLSIRASESQVHSAAVISTVAENFTVAESLAAAEILSAAACDGSSANPATAVSFCDAGLSTTYDPYVEHKFDGTAAESGPLLFCDGTLCVTYGTCTEHGSDESAATVQCKDLGTTTVQDEPGQEKDMSDLFRRILT